MIRRIRAFGLICLIMACAGAAAFASEPLWTWVKGEKAQHYAGYYGVQGLPAAKNWPGARLDAVSQVDAAGRFWVFGGSWVGHDGDDGSHNDLWRYDPASGQWTWLKGSPSFNQLGVYGTQGTPAAANTPGARRGAVAWIDKANQFWLFGGTVVKASGGVDQIDDLWRFDAASGEWTWVKGHSTVNHKGAYGVQGTAAAASMPGARYGSVSWTDSAGRFWLFGGEGFATSSTQGMLNDLWRFDPATGNWTWLKGDVYADQKGVYGVQGTAAAANTPGGRRGAVTWLDGAGRLWLFGGAGRDAAGNEGYLNDLWRYDPATNNWTWIKGDAVSGKKGVYGTLGTASAANNPGSRRAATAWIDHAGRFWMHGGVGQDAAGRIEPLNDLWRFDPATNNWTWVKGGNAIGQAGVYGTQGAAAAANTPGARISAVAMADGPGRLWAFGGYGRDASGAEGSLNDLWRYDPATNNWTWVGGSKLVYFPSVYGAMGAAGASYTPSGRQNSAFWTDSNDQFWLLGGLGGHGSDDPHVHYSGLWRFNPWSRNWACVKGSDAVNAKGVYGVQGTAAAANMPGARNALVTWSDAGGRLWLFGGLGFAAAGARAALNDLWRYDPDSGNWTWVKGSDKTSQAGVYGTQGLANAANTPGARWGHVAWTDGAGRMWLFGGLGYATTTTQSGMLNDLWRFDPGAGAWTWVKGSDKLDQKGVYGTLGTASPANGPGGRRGSVTWVDGSGQLWLFGGLGRDANGAEDGLSDLWRFNPVSGEWTWVGGPSAAGQKGVYGTKGAADAKNIPGARWAAASWVDGLGRLCLIGGYGRDAAGAQGFLSDRWSYDPAAGAWTWLDGGDVVNQAGVYGAAGTPDPANAPGARSDAVIWTNRFGEVWYFGGYGFDETGALGFLNDVWLLQRQSAVAGAAWRRLE